MKKIWTTFVIVVIAALVLSSFTNNSTGGNDLQVVDVKEVNVSGHRYVVASTYISNILRPGGVSIVHSEGCYCRQRNNR